VSTARDHLSAAVQILALIALVGVTAAALQTSRMTAVQPDDAERQARVTCGGCHAFPPPDILRRDDWRVEIERMQFIREKRIPPPPRPGAPAVPLQPDMQAALAFYTSRAPERLPAPEPWPPVSASPVRFSVRRLTMKDMPATPAVSHVRVLDFDGDGRLDVLGTDMRQGVVFSGPLTGVDAALSVVASLPHPSHVSTADIDGDGRSDLLVGDLGEFFPADHRKGAVIWLRATGGGKFSAFWLDGWPRVADVEGGDFNGDGRVDLAVAAFGWRTTGNITVVENRTTKATQPDFVNHVVDPRPGAIHVIPVDLNGDKALDFVAVLAQEHETAIAYLNTGKGDFTFEQKVIYAAPHPNWGSSGIALVDLDKDGDLDVLLTHGDSFDDGIVKPYHGIQWLENTGSYPYAERRLANMPGVHRALAADMDGDGDLDIVASALLAGGADVDEATLPALVWLEQTKPGVFARHTIEMGTPRHATIDVADIDNDGDLDIVAGNFHIAGNTPTGWVDVWVNGTK
jgi:hypothetical protein